MSETLRIAVVGATSLVGEAVLELLAERALPIGRVFALDVAEKDGETVSLGNLELDVASVEDFDFANASLAIFVGGSELSRRFVPEARNAGCAVIDFSAVYRLSEDVPLVVPGINDAALDDLGEGLLLAVPNCTVTPVAKALAALQACGLERVTVATYQSVSGTGRAALEELANQTTALFGARDVELEVYPKRISFNVLPQIGDVDEQGISEEEQSLVDELHKVLAEPQLRVEASCVRVPVFFGHGWAVTLQTRDPLTADKARELLAAGGLQIVDDPRGELPYVTPLEASGNEAVWVSRVRQTAGGTVSFWLAADNVRAGAAEPCVALAAALMKRGYFA
ncbi:aspartate-semialdehyde dehydrogenase [Vogesella sp. LYT5W]|uniref:Aspartate-semialdehyde dehydrogenase n=1 Tax=Vogesella margarita TaxID=2984199 RepID=A0ABT5IMS3_9NEIS|nr:aspartate-semialdehyde dehydrogenase [Vogesella margarita]MDC7713511.1 aspartate-semialdehyde dehydrogenase [Vogesella margarita]